VGLWLQLVNTHKYPCDKNHQYDLPLVTNLPKLHQFSTVCRLSVTEQNIHQRSIQTGAMVDWTNCRPIDLYSAQVGQQSIALSVSVCLSVCLSESISLELLDQPSRNSLCRSLVAVAWSSSGALLYVMYFRFYRWRHVLP